MPAQTFSRVRTLAFPLKYQRLPPLRAAALSKFNDCQEGTPLNMTMQEDTSAPMILLNSCMDVPLDDRQKLYGEARPKILAFPVSMHYCLSPRHFFGLEQ